MIATYKHKKLTWVDLESPTASEIKSLMKKYPIHPLVADELLRPTFRPKVDVYKNTFYLILHFPIFDPMQNTYVSYEIDFIIGKNFLITTHRRGINILVELTRIFETDAMLGKDNLSKNIGTLVFYIIKQLYEVSMDQVDHIQKKINGVEKAIFKKETSHRDLVRKISHIRRDIIDFRRIIRPHKDVFTSFEGAEGQMLGAEFTHYLTNLTGEYHKIWNTVDGIGETISSLQETNDSLLSNKTNDIMKTLTIMAFVTFPLAIFTSLFGMNTEYMPIIGAPGDFWIILGLMVLATIIMFTFFKHKKWL